MMERHSDLNRQMRVHSIVQSVIDISSSPNQTKSHYYSATISDKVLYHIHIEWDGGVVEKRVPNAEKPHSQMREITHAIS
jgi:hypothetical protein